MIKQEPWRLMWAPLAQGACHDLWVGLSMHALAKPLSPACGEQLPGWLLPLLRGLAAESHLCRAAGPMIYEQLMPPV